MVQIKFDNHQKVYFASDFHLGYVAGAEARAHERKICAWLEAIQHDAAHIFLVGDIFDLWFEYKYVIPKGFTRFLGKLATLRDKNIPITIFVGNHDCWMYDYFTSELGIPVYHTPQTFQIAGKLFYIAHGDALGPDDYFYKLIRLALFRNPIAKYLFRTFLPADIGMSIAKTWVHHSHQKKKGKPVKFFGEKEWLQQHSQAIHNQQPHDFYIYGHRHLPMQFTIGSQAFHTNLGDWLKYNTFAVFDGNQLTLKQFVKENIITYVPDYL